MKTVGEDYPCGPCGFPKKCTCGKVLTEENITHEECEGECEVCDFCTSGKCPECGAHTCCGGCV